MISITFRHVDSSDALKRYSTEKITKLQKFLRQPMTAKVTLSLDRLKQVAEVRISSGGEHLEAKEATNDMYASIDVVLGKRWRSRGGPPALLGQNKRLRLLDARMPSISRYFATVRRAILMPSFFSSISTSA